MNLGLGTATLLQLAFLGGKLPDFFALGRKSHWDNKLKKQTQKTPKTARRVKIMIMIMIMASFRKMVKHYATDVSNIIL